MATTTLLQRHAGEGETIAEAIRDCLDYGKDPEKTESGKYISAYECDPATVADEFLLAKASYAAMTGREQKKENDVLCYQIRQSFYPGEITPKEANRIGYELAMRWTKGRHAFIVTTHTDKQHIHCHIYYNSTTLDCTRKFRNFWGSSFALRRLSDRLCLENGLSVIENPKRGRKDYGKWLGDQRPLSAQEKVRDAIDAALAQRRGSSLSFLAPGQEKATRCRKKTLGDDYTPEAIQERIEGRRVVSSSRSKAPAKPARKVNLLIDIQSKLQAGKGAGYAQWAKVFNLKQMAQTISFLEENGLLEYDALAARAAEGTARFNELSGTIKRTEGRMAEIAALQKQIVNYSKTRDVYAAYRKAGYSKKFLAAHETEILLHKAAKAAFDKLCLQKLPTYKTLQAEYAGLLAEKKKAYAEYAAAKKEMQAVLTAKANVDRLLGAPPERPEQEKEQAQR